MELTQEQGAKIAELQGKVLRAFDGSLRMGDLLTKAMLEVAEEPDAEKRLADAGRAGVAWMVFSMSVDAMFAEANQIAEDLDGRDAVVQAALNGPHTSVLEEYVPGGYL